MDGVDLLPALQGGKLDPRALYWHYPHYNAHTPIVTCTPYGAVRDGPFKLIEFYTTATTHGPEARRIGVLATVLPAGSRSRTLSLSR